MMSKYVHNAIYEVLRRVCNNDKVFGGDFRQTANLVMRGTRNDTVEESIKCSFLWENVKIHNLIKNMRF